jgi:hypothetical protein
MNFNSIVSFFLIGFLRLTPKHHLFVSQGKTIFAEDVQAHETELLLFDGVKLSPVIPHRVTKVINLALSIFIELLYINHFCSFSL